MNPQQVCWNLVLGPVIGISQEVLDQLVPCSQMSWVQFSFESSPGILNLGFWKELYLKRCKCGGDQTTQDKIHFAGPSEVLALHEGCRGALEQLAVFQFLLRSAAPCVRRPASGMHLHISVIHWCMYNVDVDVCCVCISVCTCSVTLASSPCFVRTSFQNKIFIDLPFFSTTHHGLLKKNGEHPALILGARQLCPLKYGPGIRIPTTSRQHVFFFCHGA